jgi:hypothetical protein
MGTRGLASDWAEATPSEAGDERVLRSSGGDGGEHTASDDNGRGGAG